MNNCVIEQSMRTDAFEIINSALAAANPYEAVFKTLEGREFKKPPYIVSIGKAAAVMACAAYNALGAKIEHGIVLTKYGHSENAPDGFDIFEAGHPSPDENSLTATGRVLELTRELGTEDTVILLLSGGGSALFEKPLVPLERLAGITRALMNRGADINELNCVRKRLSAVKGGRFALHCAPARVEVFALSDVIGDRADVIASGPAAPDLSTTKETKAILNKYGVKLADWELSLIEMETPKTLENATIQIVGNNEMLCGTASVEAKRLGYNAITLSTTQQGEARVLGETLAKAALRYRMETPDAHTALIIGGETTVTVRGKGKGGRNQEIALSAARAIYGTTGIMIFSIGSDGTDGPTDAAGGIVNGDTLSRLRNKNISAEYELNMNNSYFALEACGGLLKTGATGTNVNDLTVALIRSIL